MVFAVNLEFKNKINGAVLERISKMADTISKSYVLSGVIGEDQRTSQMAYQNEYGNITTMYDKEPHKGEEVVVPPRPFISEPARAGLTEIKSFLDFMFFNNITKKGLKSALNGCADIMARQQRDKIELWGNIKDNSPRTVEIKGFNRPLHNSNNNPFPIKTKVVIGGVE